MIKKYQIRNMTFLGQRLHRERYKVRRTVLAPIPHPKEKGGCKKWNGMHAEPIIVHTKHYLGNCSYWCVYTRPDPRPLPLSPTIHQNNLQGDTAVEQGLCPIPWLLGCLSRRSDESAFLQNHAKQRVLHTTST